MFDSVRPHRRQPTGLPHPWDSPGKNTGAGCRFLLQCMKVKSEREVAQSCPTLCNPMGCSLPGSSVHRIFQARVLKWGAIAFSDRFNAISIKLSMVFFTELKRKITICMEIQKTSNRQSHLENENGAEGVILPDFKLYYKDTVFKTVCYWHKNRNIDQ